MNQANNWRSELQVAPLKNPIAYSDRLLSIGSCFVENIGLRLRSFKYNLEINPFGIQYNPASIAKSLERLRTGIAFEKEELFEQNGLWNSFAHHSSFSATDSETCLEGINQRLQQGQTQLLQTDVLLLTLGTAWVYTLKESGEVVSNCHRVPAASFERSRLSIAEVYGLLAEQLEQIWALRPNMRVIITLSPIRHLKDGAIENQQSKAILLLAIHELCQKYKAISYFPAYELLLDDLRDYRFYGRDLVHPNDLAIEYIGNKFEEACLSAADEPYRQQLLQLQRALGHRSFRPETEGHQKFLKEQLLKIERLEQQLPLLDFSLEKAHFKKELLK